MTNSLKCPNPSCPFLFDPSQVPAGAVLTCPRCGMRFTLGPTAGMPPPQAPASPPPPAPPEFLEPDLSIPPPAQTESPAYKKTRTGTRPKSKSGESFPWLPLLGIIVVVATAIGVGVLLFQSQSGGTSSAGEKIFRDVNIAYKAPETAWDQDDEPKRVMNANLLGFRHKASDGSIAFQVTDFKTRSPQPVDLRDGIVDRLGRVFDDLDAHEEEKATWAKQPAIKFTFRGTSKIDKSVMAGEAYAISYKGIGYWFYGWASEQQAAKLVKEFEDMRERMRILEFREDWKETTAASQLFAGEEADYRLDDGDRWWKKLDPKDEDPKAADLLIAADFKLKQKRDVKPSARLAVLILEPNGKDAIGTLKQHLLAHYDKVLDMKKWLDVGTMPLLGDPPAAGEQKGIETMRFKVDRGDSTTAKLVVISAITMDVKENGSTKPKVIGVHAYCAWEERLYWDRRLVQIASSLRPGK